MGLEHGRTVLKASRAKVILFAGVLFKVDANECAASASGKLSGGLSLACALFTAKPHVLASVLRLDQVAQDTLSPDEVVIDGRGVGVVPDLDLKGTTLVVGHVHAKHVLRWFFVHDPRAGKVTNYGHLASILNSLFKRCKGIGHGLGHGGIHGDLIDLDLAHDLAQCVQAFVQLGKHLAVLGDSAIDVVQCVSHLVGKALVIAAHVAQCVGQVQCYRLSTASG